jgi:RHS repeat-associated protein
VYGQEYWTVDDTAGMGGSYRYATAGTTGAFTRHDALELDATKTYQVFINWVASPENSTDVFINQYQNGWFGGVIVNQQVAPSDYVDGNGVAWHRITSFTGLTSYYLYVDAGSTQPGTANRVVDDGFMLLEMDSSTTTIYDAAGNVDKTIDAMGRVTDYTHNDLNQLISTTKPDPDGVGSGDPAPVHQTQYYNNGLVKKEIDPLLNEMLYEPDALGRTVKITYPDPDGSQTALASPIVKNQFDAAGRLTSVTETHVGAGTSAYTHTIDDEDTGYSMTAGWSDWTTSQSYNSDYRYHNAASGSSDYALFEFGSLDATKNYEIFASWPVFSGNATDAPYEILDAGSTVLKTMTLDQNFAPADETVGGIAWQRLGVFAGSTGYKVKVKPSATGYVGADAVRIVEVGRTTQYFYDGLGNQTAVAQPKATGAASDTKVNNQTTPPTNWTRDTTSGYQGDHLHRDAGPASQYAEWSFSSLDTTKTYAVYASWLVKYDGSNMPLNASDARYEVREFSALKATFYANQKYEPADEITDTNIKWSRLGLYKPGATSLTVRLPADANGKLVADGVRLVELGPVSKTAVNKVGNVTQTVDPLGNETISLYDRRGRLTSVYEPLRDVSVTPYRPTPVDNPTSSDWTTVEDQRAYGGSYLRANGSSSSYPTYSMAVPSLSYYPTLAVMATWTPDEENITGAQFKLYDYFNNEIGSIYVDQTVAPGDYRDETGRWWQVLGVYQMIPFNTTVKVTPQIGAQADAARLIEVGPRAFKNTFDNAGNLTQVTDAKNNDTWFYRDDLNRVKEEKNEFNESRYFEFYADSRLKKVTDREGRVIEHFYDNLGRHTEERWKNGAATVRSLTFGYDANSRLKSADDDGTAARDYDWFYDSLGRLTESEFAASSYTWELKYGYDGNSNRDSRELVRSGTTQFTDTFTWDNLNRQTKLARDAVNWGHDLRAEFSYRADGQFDQIKRFNATTGGTAFVTTHYGYDSIGRLTSLDHKNSSGTSITGYGYQYDAFGRMTSLDFTNSSYNAEDATFAYDRTHQVTSGDRWGTSNDEAYAYDGTGNRTTANGATYVTDPNNCLIDDGTFTYTYDDEGNRLTRVRKSGAAADDKTVEYLWDYRNRLEKVTFKRNDGTVTKTVDLRYDFLNRLTQKVVDPDGALGSASLQTDDYLWNGDELVGVHGHNSLVFAFGPAPDMVLFESATALHALLGDHQNTVRDVISTSGTLENHLVYSSYGELKSQTGGGAYSPFHRFTGKPFDAAVGLQYNVNRWYDPGPGRWISEDPIGFAGGDANLNRFVGNSPANWIDPIGFAKIFGQRFVWPWDENAAGVWDTIKTYASAGGVAIAGTASGAASGAAAGAGTGAVVGGAGGAFVGGVGAAPGAAAGAAGGAVAGGTWGAITGLIGAAFADDASDAAISGLKDGAVTGGAGGLIKGAATIIKVRNAAQAAATSAGVLKGHKAGQGFTGVFDANSGRIGLSPSTAERIVPPGFVPRAGGHATVSATLGGSRATHSGFAVILQKDGTLHVTWRSGTLNRTPDNLVPESLRSQIVKALEEQTGRTVSSY